MPADGFMIQIHSPAAKLVGEPSLALIDEGHRASLYEALRRQLLPMPASSEFTVAVPEFVPTKVYFMSLPTAAMMPFGRKLSDAAVPPDLISHAFILSGRNGAEKDEVIRRTAVGRDRHGRPFPIPASVYDKIRGDTTRSLLAITLWDAGTANDPSLLAIAHAIASVFFESRPARAD